MVCTAAGSQKETTDASSRTSRSNVRCRWSRPWHRQRARSSAALLAAVLLALTNATAAHAQYVQRQVVTKNGAVTFVGNALGLNKDGVTDRPGTAGSIGTFI